MLLKSLRKGNCRGMSLVEVVVVMAILSVVMLAIMSLYIPAHRSTVVQSQVADVQDNLRLAMNRLTQDILTAGFLIGGQGPIFFESGTDNDPKGFTIRTRLVGSGFGRVASATAGAGGAEVSLTLSSADMAGDLPAGVRVRLIEPVSATECDTDEPDPTKRVYTVLAVTVDDNGTPADSSDDFSVIDLDDPNSGLVAGDINPEAVVMRVADASTPAVQTIQYKLEDGALARVVNGNTQYLARNVSDVNFAYHYASSGRVERIDIEVTGETRELVANDAISGAKTRSLQSSVKLRNVF